MNPRTPDHVDLNEERLARDLRAAARQIDLTPGSELSVVTRGRRRRQRQRRATTFTLVTALTAGTAVGVQQLSRNGDDSIASEQVDETIPTGSTVATDPSAPGTTAPPPPPAQTTPPPVAASTGSDIPDDVPPAQLVESNMEWTVIEPDSTQAVGMALNSGFGSVSRVPGLALSTAPGRSDDFEIVAWRTDDGITWEQAPLDTPIGRVGSIVVDGSTMYNVGTAPGIAATEPNPLVVASSGDDGITWDQVELPIDTNAWRELPFVQEQGGVYAYAVPVDAGVVVIASTSANVDYAELAELDPRLVNGWLHAGPEGLTVAADASCSGTMPPATIDVSGTPARQLFPILPSDATYEDVCGTELLTFDQLGIPPELAAALNGSSRVFVVRGGEATEIDAPAGLGYWGEVADRAYFTDLDGAWYVLADGDELVPTDPPSYAFGSVIGSVGDTTYQLVQTGDMFSSGPDLLVAVGADGLETWTDWTGLYGDDLMPYRQAVGTTDTGIVGVVQAQVQQWARDGRTEVSAGGLTVRRTSMRVAPTFVLTDTGEEIPMERIANDGANGDFVALDADGAEVARMTAETANEILYGAGFDGQPPSEWYVETSSDGRNVSVERLAPLLGLEDDSEISSVPRISTDGTRTIIAVTLTERDATGARRQLVLVGTPKA